MIFLASMFALFWLLVGWGFVDAGVDDEGPIPFWAKMALVIMWPTVLGVCIYQNTKPLKSRPLEDSH
jgi:hypothetical protein